MDKSKIDSENETWQKAKRTSSGRLDVGFSFEDSDGNDKFLQSICIGGEFKSDEFWNSPLVKNTGTINLRPGINDDSNQQVYIFKRTNDKYSDKPSLVEMERRYFKKFNEWMTQRFDELEICESSQPIKLLADNLEFSSPARINAGKDLPPDFFHFSVTLKLGNFRCRPYFDTRSGVNCFYINTLRANENFRYWQGPTIFLKVGEIKRILEQLGKFETQF